MGRPRTFDEREVVASARALFEQLGYAATSVDDLVTTLGLHRGSLYKAFGSKRGLFVFALRHLVGEELYALSADPEEIVNSTTLDLVLIAALELGPHDPEVQRLVLAACGILADRLPDLGPQGPATLLGRRLIQRANHPCDIAPRSERS
jgi:TetR/AcrR family transcriptional repressor of nem operon